MFNIGAGRNRSEGLYQLPTILTMALTVIENISLVLSVSLEHTADNEQTIHIFIF